MLELFNMLQSRLPIKTLKENPKDSEAINHQLLVRGGFVSQLASGIFSFLPLGFRVLKRIESIIREEMDSLGAQEILMPAIHPKSLWQEVGRWDTYEPPLFKFKDQHKRELCLGPTHEEVITDLVRQNVSSYRDLPFSWYQIQDKFRNEIRATGGLLRTREFLMKDLYSFHATGEDFDDFYEKVSDTYREIYKKVGVEAVKTKADSGSIGGSQSHEFVVLAESGEDTIFVCEKCDWAQNKELGEPEKCQDCGGKMETKKGIEVGHIFRLDTKYSDPMGATFTDARGKKHPIIMGCYGIGLGRLMATIVESSHDDNGIIWPENVAPFDIHLISLPGGEEKAKEVYGKLSKDKEVLFDDRDLSAGEKFAESDLIGIPERIVVSKKTLESDSVEIKKRGEKEGKIVKISEL